MQKYIIKQIEKKIGKKLPPIPKFNHKEFFKENIEDEINYRKNLGERQGFRYLTDFQHRILMEFTKKSSFSSDLMKMYHLKDIKSLDWMIRDLYNKGYLERKLALNPFSLASLKKQYLYYLSKLGKKMLDLSIN